MGIANFLFDLYRGGLLGGQPARIRDLQEQLLKGEVGTEEMMRKPIYGKAPSGIATATGEGSAGGDILAPGTVGRPMGEIAKIAEIAQNLPLGQAVTAKSPDLVKLFGEMLFGPQRMGEVGRMFPTEPGRKVSEYEELAQREPEAGKYITGIEDLGRIFDIIERKKAPTYGTVAPGASIYEKGTGKITGQAPSTEKPRTGILGEFDEWVQANPKKTFGDYVEWKARTTSEARIQALNKRAQGDPIYKKALDIAFKVVWSKIEETLMPGLPEPTDAEVVDRVAIAADDLYKRLKGQTPTGPQDALGIRGEIDRILKERQ